MSAAVPAKVQLSEAQVWEAVAEWLTRHALREAVVVTGMEKAGSGYGATSWSVALEEKPAPPETARDLEAILTA